MLLSYSARLSHILSDPGYHDYLYLFSGPLSSSPPLPPSFPFAPTPPSLGYLSDLGYHDYLVLYSEPLSSLLLFLELGLLRDVLKIYSLTRKRINNLGAAQGKPAVCTPRTQEPTDGGRRRSQFLTRLLQQQLLRLRQRLFREQGKRTNNNKQPRAFSRGGAMGKKRTALNFLIPIALFRISSARPPLALTSTAAVAFTGVAYSRVFP